MALACIFNVCSLPIFADDAVALAADHECEYDIEIDEYVGDCHAELCWLLVVPVSTKRERIFLTLQCTQCSNTTIGVTSGPCC